MSSAGVTGLHTAVQEGGLTTREAARRRVVSGPNEITMAAGPTWRHALARQLLHPLALLLWAAAALSLVIALPQLAIAITVVIVLNAVLALWQERQTGKAIDVLKQYLPQQATVIRDADVVVIPAVDLVVGDLMVLTEGDRISADGEIVSGAVDVDMSMITGESIPVGRVAAREGAEVHGHDNRVFSGTVVLGGDAHVVVTATGMATELGRIAALSHRQRNPTSPLERQVRNTAWLIALVAVVAGAAFIPLGTLVAGLSLNDTIVFAIGLLVANVPEGLLPTITLALAMGVRQLARQGTLVRRLSAVETLGSVSTICTDKTGTLTQNNMQVADVWTRAPHRLVSAIAALHSSESKTEPTTRALQQTPALLELPPSAVPVRVTDFRFDPQRRLLSVVVVWPRGFTSVVSGAPESVVARCISIAEVSGVSDCDDQVTIDLLARVTTWANDGLRVIAVAQRDLTRVPESRDEGEIDLTLLGLVALVDPIRDGVPEAVRLCHDAGITVHVITGDHPQTAAAVAQRIGIGQGVPPPVITGEELDRYAERDLDQLLMSGEEIIFARSSPEAKLRVTDALRECGVVSAMTGDGVNDAPALRRADVGVAMGLSGTDVAREAATIVLADDNFETIVSAVEEGRRAYSAVRKFIVYIFAHATPEVIPLVLYALSGGRIPLPLTVIQILMIDIGTETLPAIALGRERAEAGVMQQPPRPPHEPLITGAMMRRAWILLGGVSAVLVTLGYFSVLVAGGWTWGADTSSTSPLHDVAVQASTMTFLGIVACQVGVAAAARTDLDSLWSIGIFSNRLLVWGIAFELFVASFVVWTPVVNEALGMQAPPVEQLVLLPFFAVAVWGVDEIVRAGRRRRHRQHERHAS